MKREKKIRGSEFHGVLGDTRSFCLHRVAILKIWAMAVILCLHFSLSCVCVWDLPRLSAGSMYHTLEISTLQDLVTSIHVLDPLSSASRCSVE